MRGFDIFWPRKGEHWGWKVARAGVAAGSLVLTSCTSGSSSGNTASTSAESSSPASSSPNTDISATSGLIAPQPECPTSYPALPGTLPANVFSWGKRVTLSFNTYGKWTPATPEPLPPGGDRLDANPPYLLVIDDARYNYPANPDPNCDKPTTLYSEPTQDSPPVAQVPDGTILKAIAFTRHGKATSEAHGIYSSTWLEVVGHDPTRGTVTAYDPIVNVGFPSEAGRLPEQTSP
jgi:hypothetical protein